MRSLLEGELTTVAACWQLERSDGAGLAITSHDHELWAGGVRHAPDPGMTPASASRSLGVEGGASEISGAVTSDALDFGDLMLGRWSGAAVRFTLVNWEAPDDDPLDLIGGELGEVAIEDEAFSAELRGAAAKLQRPVCPATSPECRARFGDKDCRVDLAGRTRRMTVASQDGATLVLDQQPGSEALLGRLRFMSGSACGLSTIIVVVDGATIRIRDLPRTAIEAGCVVEVREGCDKRLATCRDRFGNAENFRGEPHLPGNDLLTRYPGA